MRSILFGVKHDIFGSFSFYYSNVVILLLYSNGDNFIQYITTTKDVLCVYYKFFTLGIRVLKIMYFLIVTI